MNKYGRIPSVPLNANDQLKAIPGEILVNWEGQYLMGKDPSTGELVRLGDADSLYGIVNYIRNTNFDETPDNFKSDNAEINISRNTGWNNSNELVIKCDSIEDSIYVESEYKIYKDKNYTLTFYANCNKNTIMHIRFGNNIYDIRLVKSPMNKYRLVINTKEFTRSFYEGFYISFETDELNISFSQFMFEYGATANPWTDRTEITSVKVGDINVNGILSIKGVDIIDMLSNNGISGISFSSNNIVTNPKYLIDKQPDSNYDLISCKADDGSLESIAYKEFNNMLYSTYSVMIRMKAICENIENITGTVASINIYEHIDTDRLISTFNIDISEFNSEEFEEFGFLVKYNGTNSDDERSLVVEVVAHGNGDTTIQVDFIYLQIAYASLLPSN